MTSKKKEKRRVGGPGWCGTESFNTICNIALLAALFERLGRDGMWDSARDLLRELGRNNP